MRWLAFILAMAPVVAFAQAGPIILTGGGGGSSSGDWDLDTTGCLYGDETGDVDTKLCYTASDQWNLDAGAASLDLSAASGAVLNTTLTLSGSSALYLAPVGATAPYIVANTGYIDFLENGGGSPDWTILKASGFSMDGGSVASPAVAMSFAGTNFKIGSSMHLKFFDNAIISAGSANVGITRNAAGELRISNGGGSYGGVDALHLQLSGQVTMTSPAPGVAQLTDAAGTGTVSLAFGPRGNNTVEFQHVTNALEITRNSGANAAGLYMGGAIFGGTIPLETTANRDYQITAAGHVTQQSTGTNCWSSTTGLNGTFDTCSSRAAAGIRTYSNASTANGGVKVATDHSVKGAYTILDSAVANCTFGGGAGTTTCTTSAFIPYGATVLSITGRQVTPATTCTTCKIGADLGAGLDDDLLGTAQECDVDTTTFDQSDYTADIVTSCVLAGGCTITMTTEAGGDCVDGVASFTVGYIGGTAATAD